MRDYTLNRAMAAESIGTSNMTLFRSWRARRQMAVLAKCDDKHLQELGIIRDEVLWATRLPLSQNSQHALEECAFMSARPRLEGNTMQTNQAISIKFQSTPHAATVRTWIRGKLDAFRQKQITKREITYLRTMEDHMLKDMGIDISALVEIYPTLESSRNNLKCETSGFFNLPVNMSTR